MSKSTGNFIMTRDLLERRDPRAVRFFLLSAQYRHPLNYTEQALDQAEQGLNRIDRCLRNLAHRIAALQQAPAFLPVTGDGVGESVMAKLQEVREAFIRAMDDDFNTADAITAIFDGVREANTYMIGTPVYVAELTAWQALIEELLEVLGLEPKVEGQMPEEEILSLIEARNAARRARDFAKSDAIRDELAARGVVLEDTPQGTRWSYRK